MKKWVIKKPDEKIVSIFTAQTDLTKLCAEVLAAREFTDIDSISTFFLIASYVTLFYLRI